ncbi:hypothetical protein EJA70_25690 [Pseudomonas sp. PB103]|nr:hypothetical protein EJA70_25690 [Pseudomonas sp. PB103]
MGAVHAAAISVQNLNDGYARVVPERPDLLCCVIQDAIAGKPAPTGISADLNNGDTTETCGSWLASDDI